MTLEKFFESSSTLTETARTDYEGCKSELSVLKEGELLDFQKKALENAGRLLCEYGQINFCEEPEEGAEKWRKFLREKYEKINIQKYEKGKTNYFENEVNFWMATGSGKTYVISKLIDNLLLLIKTGVIPAKPIMVLAPNETILGQIKETANRICTQDLSFVNLKDYRDELFPEIVYFYNSTNIASYDQIAKKSDGERINFEDYGENWYVILDEAHKGSGEEAKRREYYRSFARTGLLFNFSATLTEIYDRNAVIFNYNLSRLLNDGYGKRVAIMQGDYKEMLEEGENSYKTILKSLILFTALKRAKPLKGYHNPLMLAVADTVNTENAKLRLFFECMFKFKDFADNFAETLKDLKKDTITLKCFLTKEEIKGLDLDFSFEEVLKHFYNTNGSADEILYSYDKTTGEIAFKMKNGFDYFALLKISAGEKFLEYLSGEVKEEKVLIKDFFKSLNKPENNLSILLGSKCFNEGWDSNRPNVINFINIGSAKARQYVMQTIGRGVRIEPSKGHKKRTGESILENLFIFTTHKSGAETILSEIGKEEDEKTTPIEIKKCENELELYIPEFRKLEKSEAKFLISEKDLEALQKHIEGFSKKHLIAKYKLKNFTSVSELQTNVKKQNIAQSGLSPEQIFKNLANFKKEGYEVSDVKLLEEEINHYARVRLIFKDKFKDIAGKIIDFIERGEIDREAYERMQKEASERKSKTDKDRLLLKTSFEEFSGELQKDEFHKFSEGFDLQVNYNLQKHYYNPFLYSENIEDLHITNVINEKSEIEFLENLLEAKDFLNENFKWCFSRNAGTEVAIPYFEDGALSNFYPDFIFWLERKNSKENFIIFVDPKGILLSERNTLNKIKGFEDCLKGREIKKSGKTFKFALGLYNAKTESENEKLEAYRFHNSLEFFRTTILI